MIREVFFHDFVFFFFLVSCVFMGFKPLFFKN
uniref:Lipoprotein n=1 Tax=Rhizophora mucronata TaxID=61149 RepID=A0A2P2Q5T3_RHIMU